jgi:hypothetical protein
MGKSHGKNKVRNITQMRGICNKSISVNAAKIFTDPHATELPARRATDWRLPLMKLHEGN